MQTEDNNSLARIEPLIELFKKFSIFGSLFLGTWLALLYFFGIAVYDTHQIVLGVPPFDFSLQKCLEHGVSEFVDLMTILPILILLGIIDNLKEATLIQYFGLILPIILFLVLHFLNNRTSKWSVMVQKWTHWALLLYLGVFLVAFSMALLLTYSTQNLLLNPAINTLIEHREELLKNLDLSKVGLPQMDLWTANIVIHDRNWLFNKIGAMYSLAGLLLVYGLFAIRASARYYSGLTPIKSGHPKWFGFLRFFFIVVFGFYIFEAAFVVPARTATLSSMTRAKVDIVVKGFEAVTAKYYMILVGDFSDQYAFYLPTQQNVIVVQKSKVDAVRILEKVSIFADRKLFIKDALNTK